MKRLPTIRMSFNRIFSNERSRNLSSSLCYTSAVWLSTEIDGIRIITTKTFDFFERLPDELFHIFNVLSSSPGSKLYNAYMNYKYENQTAEMLLKQLKSAQAADGLEVAVKQCIAAASHEHDPAIQKVLLKVSISSIKSMMIIIIHFFLSRLSLVGHFSM